MPIPVNLKYSSKVEGSSAKSFRQSVPPNGATSGYQLGDTIMFNIPTRQNLVLVPSESYLQFDFQINNTSGAGSTYRLESCGIHALFQRVRETHGNNTITDFDNYGMLAKELYDLQSPLTNTYGKLNVLTGSRGDFVTSTVTGGAFAANTTTYLPVTQINSGELLGTVANNASTVARTYCVNLISILGSLCPKTYIPLFAMTSSPIKLDVQLVDSILKMCCATAGGGTITMTNISFVAQFIELSDQAMGEVYSQLPDKQRIEFPFTNYKNFTQSANALGASSQFSINIPAKYASLKSYLVSQREGTGIATKFPLSSIVNSVASYQFKIGPNTIPSNAPTKTTEMFAELLKVMGSISDINYCPNIDLISYTMNANVVLDDANFNKAGSGSFYIGLDLEGFPNSNKDQIFAGYNSSTDDSSLMITYGSAGNPPVTAPRFDVFACFDSVFVCENGVAYTRQ